MSGPTYLHHEQSKQIKNGKVTIHEEQVIDGPKGLSFKLYKRDGDKKEKIVGKRNKDGTFTIIHIKGDKKDSNNYTVEELKKEIKKHKELDFVNKYVSTAKIARQSRKMSRASSRRRSRAAKKASRKAKKTSRKTSRKAKRTSRKGSRKAKKTSRRRKSRR